MSRVTALSDAGRLGRVKAALRGRSLRAVLLLVGGAGGGQAVVLLSSPVLTRLYSPADFGLLAAYAGLLSPLLVVASFQYEQAVPLPGDDRTASALVALGLCSVTGVAAVVAVVAATAGGAVGALLGAPALGRVLWLLPVGVLAAGAYRVLSYWSVRVQAFPSLSRTKLTQGAGMALAQVGLGALGFGAAGLVAGDVVGRSGGSGTLAALAARSERWSWAGFRWSRMRAAATAYRRYPALVTPGNVLNALGTQLPALLLVGLYGAQAAGWFALTQRVIAAPLALVGAAVAQVYLGEAARTAREDPAALGALYRSGLRRLAVVGTPPLVVAGLVAPVAFPAVFGAEWQEAGWYAAVLAVPFALQFAASPLNQMLNVLGREDVLLGWNVARFVLIGGAVVGAWWAGADALTAVGAFGAAFGASYVLAVALTLAAIRRSSHSWHGGGA